MTPINISPFKAIAVSMLTRAIGLAGAALVAKGYTDASTVSAAVPEIVGSILALGSIAWGWYRAQHLNTKLVAAAKADPATVTLVGPGGVAAPASAEALASPAPALGLGRLYDQELGFDVSYKLGGTAEWRNGRMVNTILNSYVGP